jgi:hypothetical protein
MPPLNALTAATNRVTATVKGTHLVRRSGLAVAAGPSSECVSGARTASPRPLAELAFAEQRTDEALVLQTQAVAAAADADGSEPPMLASGPRQRLGGMQLRAKRFAAAEQRFRAVLASHPRSGWALHGLEKALSAQGKQAEAQSAQRELAISWALADNRGRAEQ